MLNLTRQILPSVAKMVQPTAVRMMSASANLVEVSMNEQNGQFLPDAFKNNKKSFHLNRNCDCDNEPSSSKQFEPGAAAGLVKSIIRSG